MFEQGNGYSLADIAAATNSNNEGFGGNGGAWWIIILFLFCFMGGWGGNGGASTAVTQSDFNGLRNTLSDMATANANGFYNANTSMLNGFNATDNAIANAVNSMTNGFNTTNLGMANLNSNFVNSLNTTNEYLNANTRLIQSDLCNLEMTGMQNKYDLSTMLSQMAAANSQQNCQTSQLINSNFADLNYNLATQACANRQAVTDGARDIIENNNNNTRAILDFLVQDKIDTLSAENASLRSAASQAEQNAYLLAALRPQANPAYIVANPYSSTCTSCTGTY